MSRVRRFSPCIIVLLLLALVMHLLQPAVPRAPLIQIAYSDFLTDAEAGRVSEVLMQGHVISGTFKDGHTFLVYAPDDSRLLGRLSDTNVRVVARPEAADTGLAHYLLSWLPMLLLIGALWSFTRPSKLHADLVTSLTARVQTLENEVARLRGSGRDAAGA